jgi:glycosyltransferase involved in cell wall biosynthesis
MKIVIVSPAYPLRGGIANFTAQLYQELIKENEVRVFTFKRQYPKLFFPGKTQLEVGDNVDRIPSRIEIDSINPISWIKTANNIIKEKPDLVIFKYWMPFFAICYGVIANKIRKVTKTQTLTICHNLIPHEKNPGDDYLTKYFLSKMDYFILLSNQVANDLKKFISSPKSKVLPHPIYSRFGNTVDKQTALNQLKLKENNYLLFFGFIRDYKGLDVLVEAMNLIKDQDEIKLIVAGEFYEDEKRYLKLIAKYNLSDRIILFKDFIPTLEVKYYFSVCDAVILPYRNATQSGIVQMAINFNKPVIATNVGGVSEVIVNDETGYIVEKENPEALAKAIKRFYIENNKNKFSKNISKLAEKYSWKYFVNGMFDLINS